MSREKIDRMRLISYTYRVVRAKYDTFNKHIFEWSAGPQASASNKYNVYGMPNTELEDICQEVSDMFTQQHYELLAKTLEESVMRADKANDEPARLALVEYVHTLTMALEKDNPKFKKLRFIEAALAKANAARSATKEEG